MDLSNAIAYVAPLKAPTAGHCIWSADYDCNCSRCSYLTRSHWYISAFVWSIANAASRAEVETALSGLQGLALIGQAVKAALSPGLVFNSLVDWAVDAWTSSSGELRGLYFRVVGKRGKAAQHVGKVGICNWVGENTFGYHSTKSTIRLGLAVEGEQKLIYVAHSQCERMATPAEVARAKAEAKVVSEAIAAHRPKWVGSVPAKKRSESSSKWKARCPIAYIVSGREAGKSGRVFWIGADKKTSEVGARLGIECTDGGTAWVSAYDCTDRPMVPAVSTEERLQIERVAADAALEGDSQRARELLAQTRREA